jgi:8-oxo-dGTP pyrophosphatase MutT (NUDIX family)
VEGPTVADQRGSGILFFRQDRRAVLLFRRDNDPAIPCPGQLDIPGGMVEAGETPEQAVVREMAEELDDLRTAAPYRLTGFQLFHCYTDERGTEQNIFFKEADFDLADLRLKEGQELLWVEAGALQREPLAFGFNAVVQAFFQRLSTL